MESGERSRNALGNAQVLNGLDDFEALHHSKMALVESCHGAAALQCGGGQYQIVSAYDLAAGLELCPEACVDKCCLVCIRNNVEGGQAFLEEFLPLGSVRAPCTLDSMPQFRNCYGRNLEFLCGERI